MLLTWYGANRRKLPWRRSRDPYRIWVSEIMLQQTTVPAVIPYFERWLEVFPDVRSLARAPLRRVLREWQGLGYYQRARNLHRSAKLLVREHGAKLPADAMTLRRLPGFGVYTTAAVLSLAFGHPTPVVDANVRRVLMRLLGIRGKAEPRVDTELRGFLDKVFPPDSPGDFNQAMMELGALLCRSRSPQCLSCPVRRFCRAAKEGTQETIPLPKELRLEKIEVVVAVIERDGKVLLQERSAGGLLAGLWEFPGGKVEPGEGLQAALRREIREELGAEIGDIRRLTTVRHAYTRFEATLHAFRCRLSGDGFKAGPRQRWVTPAGIRKYPLPSGSVKIVDFLESRRRA
ncbi:MAG: A/G-specific adenine glycosylase [Candidatus Aminicenantes bacterium RBG_16_66_30]